VLDGILYVLRSGCPWKHVPRNIVSGSTCHRRFSEWVKTGKDVGSNPTDRGKPGTKKNILTDTSGIPLSATICAANKHDKTQVSYFVLFTPLLKANDPTFWFMMRIGMVLGFSLRLSSKLVADPCQAQKEDVIRS